jgi:outer membrane protein OmpA-like peptidoglycan-associated protein
MTTIRTTLAALGVTAAMASVPGLALGQDAPAGAPAPAPATLKGMIISHNGPVIVVRRSEGDTPVLLTPTTNIRGVSGALGMRGEDHPPTDLIRGLAVQVNAVPTDAGRLAATNVTFKNSDLKTAQQINAGLAATDAGVNANAQRIDNIGLLKAVGRTKVYFPVGSSTLSAAGKQDLQTIAAQAKGITGAYRVAVVGRADTSGAAAANERLSQARADAVRNYLIRTQGISPANFIPDTALGSSPLAQDPDPPKTAADARRVTVTLAVSKSNPQADAH